MTILKENYIFLEERKEEIEKSIIHYLSKTKLDVIEGSTLEKTMESLSKIYDLISILEQHMYEINKE